VADLATGQGAAPAEWPPTAYGQPVAGQAAQYMVDAAFPPGPVTQTVQAAAEGVVAEPEEYDTVVFYGEKFRLAEKVSLMPMLAFANASKKGLDSDDMEGLAAMYALIRSVIHRPVLLDEHGARVVDENGRAVRDETEWNRFESLAIDENADGDDIMGVVNQAMEIMSARPRKPREISSGSSRPTSEKSRGGLSSPVRPPELDGLRPVADLGR
jgi:hypothetical protein